jgi:hypothetical protein
VIRIGAVLQTAVSTPGLLGRAIDLPKSGQTFDADAIPIAGWVLGTHEPVERVEVAIAGRVIASGRVDVVRPEVASSNPGVFHAVQCGFRLTAAVGHTADADLDVQAVMRDGRRLPIAVIRSTRR